MASHNLQECEVHCNDEAFTQGIRGNFYEYKLGNRDVVVKCIKKSSNQQTIYENVTKEILLELCHQNIIQIFSFEVDDNYFHVKTELCNLDLHQYLSPYNIINRSQEVKLDILRQIGKGLKYLHNHNKPIIHGNLRPQNVLIKQSTDEITQTPTLTVRLSDFYCQGVFHKTNPKESRYCISPEVLADGNNVTTAVDIYAYGCLIHTVVTDSFYESYHPFGKLDDENFLKNVAEGKRINRLSPSTVNEDSNFLLFRNLVIDDCTDANFERRPTLGKNKLFTVDEEPDFFILADLAIDDATGKCPEERPKIATLLKHPVFWTEKHKEIFFTDIVENYIKDTKEKYDFLKEFEMKMGKSLKDEDWKKIYPKCNTLTSNLGDGKYKTLLIFIRNKCAHFAEDKAKFRRESKERSWLGKNITEFIRKICENYPFLVFNLFTCYRKYVIAYVKDNGEHIPVNFLSYFDNLSKDILEDNNSKNIPSLTRLLISMFALSIIFSAGLVSPLLVQFFRDNFPKLS